MDKLDIPREEVKALVKELAAALGETTTGPVKQIKRIIQYCGVDFARSVFNETMEIEAQGGMMLPTLERRRTAGGVFFYLTRQKISEEQHDAIFPPYRNRQKGTVRPRLGVPLLKWKERIKIIESLKADQGEVTSMKVSLTGRPGSVEKRSDVVVTTMSYVTMPENIPRELPRPPETSTLYTIYMLPRQWESVEEAMADPADRLMIDGICAFDSQTNGMAVFVINLRSEIAVAKAKEATAAAAAAKQQQKKQAKEQKPAAEKPAAKTKGAAPAQPQAQAQTKDVKKSRFAEPKAEPAAAVVPLNPNLPPDIARKLNELNASASLFRQKVNNLLAKPPGQQFGLEMTQKLLKNVEDEIAALKKKHNV